MNSPKARFSADSQSRRLWRHIGMSLADPSADASRRLALLGLVMATITAIYVFVLLILPLLGGPTLEEPFGWLHILTIGLLPLALAVFFLARSPRLSPQRKLDIGLIYEVVLAALAGIGMKLAPGPMRMPGTYGVSEICLLILLFPVIVPNTPRRVLFASLVAATMDPVGVWLAGATGKPMPPGSQIFHAFFLNYVCAGLALVPTLILTRLGRQVTEARKMGSYRLVELLGRGGMGEVWQASHVLLAREAAVKLIRPENLGAGKDSETLLRRFEREAQATANLHSQHTIHVYDFGIAEDNTFFYVMELLNGLDLQTLVERFGPQPAERAIHLLRQACESLWDAHQSGFIHRDIKPANLYACRYGHVVDFVKVLDFGLVRTARDAQSEFTQLTMSDTITGTPAYMAPEMAMSQGEIDARADLYALGCVGYWLLTAQRVFDRDAPLQMLGAHLQDPPIPPSQRTEMEIPATLEAAILACLEKDPARRPQTAKDLAERLSACPVPSPWTQQQAAGWWETHLP